MKKLLFGLLGFPFAAFAAYMDVTTDKDPIAYAVGETAELNFSVEGAEGESISWTVKGDDGVTDSGTGSRVRVTCSKPGFVCVEAKTSPSALGYTASVGFGVASIAPDSTRPEDLKGFWDNRLTAIQDSIDPSKVAMTYVADANGCHVYQVKLDDLPDGLGPCTGWLSIPVGADSGAKYRADGFFFGYDNSWAADNRARPTSPPNGYIQFRVMAHAFELGRDQAYYDEFKLNTQSNGKTHGLDPVQNANPLTSYFNGMACRDIRAMLFLKTLESWNGTELTTTGHSQGGLQSIWAGLAPGVTQINPECPWNCNMYGPSKAGRVTGGRLVEQWVAGLDYYDPCFVGRLISLDCEVNLTRAGLADYTCPPSGIAAFYNTLPQQKSIRWLQGSSHSQNSIPTVQHWFDGVAAKNAAFSAAADYADTKAYVPVLPEEGESDDGYCGDISAYDGLTNRFVSKGGTWGANDQKYTSVQAAVAAAKAGDVIWLHDGFVCEPATADDWIGSGGGSRSHFKIEKNITLRSVSGDARGAANPPRLRGRYHDEEAGTKTGDNAIRPLHATTGKYMGLVFEHGAHNVQYGYCGAAIFGSGYSLQGCVIRDCHGTRGVISAGVTITDCVITNNTGSGVYTSGEPKVYNTLFAGNAGYSIYLAASDVSCAVVSNCTFRDNLSAAISSLQPLLEVRDSTFVGNTATERGPCLNGKGKLYNCFFANNYTSHTSGNYKGEGGAVYGDSVASCVLYDCTIVSNRTTNTSSGHGGGVYTVTAYRCKISDNVARGDGGGAYGSVLYDCEVLNNESINGSSTTGGVGGGVCGGSATRCLIAGNVATNRVHVSRANGGGAFNANLYNCTISNNLTRGAYNYGGGGVCFYEAGHEAVNCLVVGNRNLGSGVGGITGGNGFGGNVVNCTVAGNTAGSGVGGVCGVTAVNTISWGNTGSADSFVAANNCCSAVLTDTAAYPDCLSADPKFANNGFSDYELAEDSPCVDTALTQQWMLEVGGTTAKALNGNDRVIGVKPDMGCFEFYKQNVPSTCTVTFDLGEHGVRTGGGELIQLVAYQTAAVAPTVEPNDCLWAFEGWDAEFASVTEDMTVTAVYSAIDPETVQHTVTFDLGGHGDRTGGGEMTQTVTHFHPAIDPEFTSHEGWAFQGWSVDVTSIVADTDAKAVWKRVEVLPVEGAGEEGAPIDVSTLTDLVNRFVSSDGTWGGNDQRYTDLQSAMKASNKGDVIWLRNGYVERPADANDHDNGGYGGGTRSHFKFDKVVTVRSLYGDARADPNPPRIWGRWHDPDADPVVKEGDNAIRALWVAAAATFQGIVFENSSCRHNISYRGGCVVGDSAATFSKCVFRNNVSYDGTIRGGKFIVTDCVITNNQGGGVFYAPEVRNTLIAGNTGMSVYHDTSASPLVVGCTISNNFTSLYGSGIYSKGPGLVRVLDTVVVDNFAYQRGAGFVGQGVISNCVFAGNHTNRGLGNSFQGEGAAICGDSTNTCFVYDCVITNNWSENTGNAHGAGVYRATVLRSLIADNVATGDGGGAYECDLTDCVIRGNEAKNVSSNNGGHGGGVARGRATRCVIAENKAVEHSHPTPGDGGGAYNASLYNCTVVSNLSNSIYGSGGGAVCFTESGLELVNCLVADNVSQGSGVGGVVCGDTRSCSAVNCTVAGNSSSRGVGGARNVAFVNSISWGNAGTADMLTVATNSCSAVLTDAELCPGCIARDPKFVGSGAFPYAIRMGSPCKDKARVFAWMEAADDPRATALDGNARILGNGPDMGCYEHKSKGMLLFVR